MSSKVKKIMVILGVCLVVAATVLIAVYFANTPERQAGSKTIDVEVVMAEGDSQTFTYTTDSEMLGEVLQQEGLVEGQTSEYGLFITTVNGVTADDANQEWWCITKGGENVNTGVDMTPIADGDHFEITLTVGYEEV